MHISQFDFTLPESLIALYPKEDRASSKLLHVSPDNLFHREFSELPNLLSEQDILVINNTKVIPAKFYGQVNAKKVEFNLFRNLGEDIWLALAKPARKINSGDKIIISDKFYAEVLDKSEGEIKIRLISIKDKVIDSIKEFGEIPLPPYITKFRQVEEKDKKDYQTIYAKKEGAVAAPTAGLHFTDEIFDRLKAKGINIYNLTLHVGAGTFLPVKVDNIKDHKMHAEFGEITEEVAAQINQEKKLGKNIVAVGTTSLRLLESAASPDGYLNPFLADTDIFISPGYKFKIVDKLVTNFHLPKSTLFMLVSAFMGLNKMQFAYSEAIKNNYKFFSYGDACLLEREIC